MIEINDLVNALFEGFGSILLWMNVKRLYKDKEVKGVYWPVNAFFASWGLWNLYYYPSVGHTLSFYAGIVLVLANLVWTSLAIYYIRKNGK
jgi:hypothetical protein